MEVNTIYISTYRYDFQFAKRCIASVRYWYPHINIKLIKDYGAGNFNTAKVQKAWDVELLDIPRKTFGWGYGKLEPLFHGNNEKFLVLDADTVITGPVLDAIQNIQADFIVDEEIQPTQRFNEIYYNLDRIAELAPSFQYPGYSFNSGQWFGTSGRLSRADFEKSLEWSEPPKPKYPDIVFKGDQAHLNFTLHYKEQENQVKIARQKLMIWPEGNSADFIGLEAIRSKSARFPFIIHWAGMKFRNWNDLPRTDILQFYADIYYKKMGAWEKLKDAFSNFWLPYERKWKHYRSLKK